MGTASLICGIAGLLGLFISGPRFYYIILDNALLEAAGHELYYLKSILIFSIVLSILTIVFGAFGYDLCKKRGDSQAGISLGIISLTLVFIFMFAAILRV
jgi:hypothetical protein